MYSFCGGNLTRQYSTFHMNRSLSKKGPVTQQFMAIEPKPKYRGLFKKTPATQQSLLGAEPKSTDKSLPEKCPATQHVQLLRPKSTYRSLFKNAPLTQQELWAIKPQSKVNMTLPKKSPATHQLLKSCQDNHKHNHTSKYPIFHR